MTDRTDVSSTIEARMDVPTFAETRASGSTDMHATPLQHPLLFAEPRPDKNERALSWWRIVALALVIALHAGILLRLALPPQAWRAPSPVMSPSVWSGTGDDDALSVVFIAPATATREVEGPAATRAVAAAPTPKPTPEPAPPIPRTASAAAQLEPATHAVDRAPATADAPPTTPVEQHVTATEPTTTPDAAAPAPRLFRADGSIALPAQTLEDLREVDADDRVFDYVVPGLTTADTAFQRKPLQPYEPTRFDADWAPVRSIGGALLNAVVEKLTFENRRGTVRCVVPLGCVWGDVGTPVELDDPDTLNPDEAAQCRATWDAIVAATEQNAWRALRARYDAECRKPLERARMPPAE